MKDWTNNCPKLVTETEIPLLEVPPSFSATKPKSLKQTWLPHKRLKKATGVADTSNGRDDCEKVMLLCLLSGRPVSAQ